LLGVCLLLAAAVVITTVSFAIYWQGWAGQAAYQRAVLIQELQALRDRIHVLEEDNRALAVGEIDDRLRELHAEARAMRDRIKELKKEAQAYQDQVSQRDARLAEIERSGMGLPWGWVLPALGLAVLCGCLCGTVLWSYTRRGTGRQKLLEREEPPP